MLVNMDKLLGNMKSKPIAGPKLLSLDNTHTCKVNLDSLIIDGQTVQSEPVHTSQSGYNLALSFGICVDEQSEKSYLSISFIILPGEFDAILPWPFRFPITISILDLKGSKKNISHSIPWDARKVIFNRPASNANVSFQITQFCLVDILRANSNTYVQDGFIFVQLHINFMESCAQPTPNKECIDDQRPSFDNKYEKKKLNYEADDWHPLRNDVILDVYNCDLTMIVKHGCLRGEPMIENGLCSLWSGIRATYGIDQGRVAFQIKILRYLHSSDLLYNEIPFGIRVGWSTNESDELLSFGYEGTGKIWTGNQFEWYGEQYSVGDIITCYADFESERGHVLLSFAKNDLNFELAYRINSEDFHSRPLFPHIFIKNISYQVNFGQLNTKYSLRPGFCFINDYEEDDRIRGTLGPSSKEECEVIMMVGLPGAGKSFWVERHCAINTDKKYILLSTNNIIQQMKTNVYGNNRRRKMSLFDGFYRRAVVVIPDDNEYQRRRYKQQIDQSKFIPDSFINQMKANFDLPEVADIFDDVEYAELTFRYARDLVMYYRHQSHIIKERLRKPNRRKKKNNLRSIRFSYDRHTNNIDLSSNHHHYHFRPFLSHPKQYHHYLSKFDHHYYRN
ncbi:unnamed protein product, partial [Rotaria sp. Silwood1]